MKKSKLIYTAIETSIERSLSAYYYGTPDNKIYVIYKSPYAAPTGKTSFEFTIAKHEQFHYNFAEDKIIENLTHEEPLLTNSIDHPNVILSIVKSSKTCKTHVQAEQLLNSWITQEMGIIGYAEFKSHYK